MKKTISVLALVAMVTVSIHAATLHVTKPNNGEPLKSGTPFTITWTSSGNTGPLKLILLRNGTKVDNIVENLAAGATSFNWTVGNYMGGTAAPGGGYAIRVRTMDNATSDDSDAPFAICNTPFALTAPNGGESWPQGSTRLITWDPCGLAGSVRLDLYKGGTDLNHIIGCITGNTPAAAGQFSWRVGDRQGILTPAAAGNDYYVVVHAYTPDLRDPGNGPFSIAPPQLLPSYPQAPSQSFALIIPNRGNRWYKGTGYTITWTTGGLASPVRLDLFNINGSTLVQPIAENIPNNGKYFWAVPMSLPDAETIYRIRVQTMDGAHSDMPAGFYIAKAKVPAGPPAIKVLAPKGPNQLGTGLTYPIRWTSTCGTSANGPTDDAFDIELMNAAGTARVRWLLQYGQGTYDGGNPDGSHSWHWDWQIPRDEATGTYRVRVTNMSGHCSGIGETFPLVYQQEFKEYTLNTVSIQNCYHIFVNTASFLELTRFNTYNVFAPTARVGFRWYWGGEDHKWMQHIVYHSLVRFGDDYWYKDKGHVREARLIIKRKYKMSSIFFPSYSPVLGGVVVLTQSVPCQNGETNADISPASAGVPVAVDSHQGDAWEVDLTQPYAILVQHGRPDRGVMLYPTLYSDPGCGADICDYNNAEWFEVTLKIRFAKDITE